MYKRGLGVDKFVLIVVAIVVVVGIILSSPGVLLTPAGPDTGTGGGGFGFVNAHACARDDTCEMNGAMIDDVVIDGKTVSTGPGSHNLILDSSSGQVNVENDLMVNGRLRLSTDSIECDTFPRVDLASGDETCLNNDYDYCLVAEYVRKTTYYNSTDRSCTGAVQTTFKTPYHDNCPASGVGSGGGGCGFTADGAEPFYGDGGTSTDTTQASIICCR